MKAMTIALMAIGLIGCASTMTEDEIMARAERDQVTYENYALCRHYFMENQLTWTLNNPQYQIDRTTGWAVRPADMRSEMAWNHCRINRQ